MTEKDLKATGDDQQVEELADASLGEVSGGGNDFVAAGPKVDVKCPACRSRDDVYRVHTFGTSGPYQCRTCGLKFGG